MKLVLNLKPSSFINLLLIVSLAGATSIANGADKAKSRSKSASTILVRAQDSDSKLVPVASTSVDEEIFDKDLTPSAQFVESTFTDNPHCTDVFGGNQGTIPPSNSSSPLTNSDSVLSPQQPPSQLPAPVTSLGAGQGASTAMSSVPAFMGDFFAGSPTLVTYNGYNTSTHISVPSNSGVGVMKLAENTSPLPRDRVFLSYNYFADVNLTPGGTAVNRMTPGFEKTFFNRNASIEVRLPMAFTLGSNTPIGQNLQPVYDTNQYEFGNVTTYFKALLYRDDQTAVSAGLGVGAPTANNTRITNPSGSTTTLIRNQTWDLMPFIGTVHTPSDRWFAQTMLQFDFAANGNSVATDNGRGGLQSAGSLNQPTYLFGSVGTGYWIYQNPEEYARLSRVSLISELHFNTTLQHTDTVQGNGIAVGTYQSQIQTVNAVVGTNVMFGQNKSLMVGYVTPLGSSDQAFAGELRVLFNWYFGAQNQATRVQF